MGSNALTNNQTTFVRYYVREGCNQTEAARRAGYGDPGARAWELMRKPHVQDAIFQEQRRLINGDLANIALSTLKEIMVNPEAPTAARVTAARTALEIGGYLKKENQAEVPQFGGRAMDELTAEELDRLIEMAEADIESQTPEG